AEEPLTGATSAVEISVDKARISNEFVMELMGTKPLRRSTADAHRPEIVLAKPGRLKHCFDSTLSPEFVVSLRNLRVRAPIQECLFQVKASHPATVPYLTCGI